jgi:hypothetical protein
MDMRIKDYVIPCIFFIRLIMIEILFNISMGIIIFTYIVIALLKIITLFRRYC